MTCKVGIGVTVDEDCVGVAGSVFGVDPTCGVQPADKETQISRMDNRVRNIFFIDVSFPE
jgi:hypothetical protein